MKVESRKSKVNRWIARIFLVATLCVFPVFVHAATADLSITQQQITFSQSTLYAGDVVRIYARVRNLGETDMTATVFFYQGSSLIAAAQPISLTAEGATEEVFVDFTVPSGSFNIRAVIQGAEPADENASNNEATTPLYTAVEDADRDGVADDDDNCPSDSNADQNDTDGDGQGDVCDSDDDGDGVSDSKEHTAGTDRLDADTDDDGLNDKVDPSPLTAPAPEDVVTISAPVNTASDTAPTSTPTTTAVAMDVADDTATDDTGIAAPTTAYGVLNISPHASFSYIQFDWNTFGFDVQSPQPGVTYTWDFGDGSSSALVGAQQDYDGPGTYMVTLTSRDAEGNEAVDTQEVTVSFFNLQNPWVQALLGLCVVVLFALGILLVAMRRGHEDEDV